MTQLKIKLLAFQGAPRKIFDQAIARIEKYIAKENYILAESDPDILFFLSGGSEQAAIQQVMAGKFVLLIGSQHDNSYASASEVKAYLNAKNIPSLLLDEGEPETRAFLKNYQTVIIALRNLKGKRLGLIGQVSDWLIASAMPAELLDSTFGIKLNVIPWGELAHFSEYKASESFLDTFAHVKEFYLSDTAKVNEQLLYAIQKWKLDAITVECFPLVKKDKVTACLPLAKFNDNGIPAGCEGDLTAIAGMMLCKELTGIIPWIANINKITSNVCLFSHCTIAPGLVNNYSVMTHFETGEGTAIQGDFKSDVVTIFRFDNQFRRAFIATTRVTGRPKLDTACRTQIEVKLTENEVMSLKNNPLGNHHLIFPGNCKELLQATCMVLGIEILP